ncbi:XrtX-associated membrane protein [Hymenobacter antarcticus]|uniref:XrtX-associated membrane protein n=1 Tax=Hymenobacter antarcticus TaxID=486270 RepID=UPI0031EF40EB
MPATSRTFPAPTHRLTGLSRWVLVGALLAALFLIGVYDEVIHALLTSLWQRLLAAAGLGQQVRAVQQGVSGGVTKRLLPAVATYAALYLGICLLLLRLLLPTGAQWHLALRLYLATLVVYVAMVVAAKLAGNVVWAYRLSRHILDFVVSPLPVAGLYVLFRAGFGPQPPRA